MRVLGERNIRLSTLLPEAYLEASHTVIEELVLVGL